MSSYPLWRPLVNKGAVTILNDSHDTFISSAEEFVDSCLEKKQQLCNRQDVQRKGNVE